MSNQTDSRRFGLAFLSGLALGASYPVLGLYWMAWVVPGLLLLLGAGQRGSAVFRIGFYAGLGNFLCSLYWFLLIPMRVKGAAAWVLLSICLALFYGAWCWVCWRGFPATAPPPRAKGSAPRVINPLLAVSWRQRVAWAAFCGIAWAAMELTIARFLSGFPWNLLGASQYRLLPLIQIASVTGVQGISFMVVWVSTALSCAVWMAWRAQPAWTALARELAVPFLALAGAILFGCVKLSRPEPASAHLKVALVQPAIPQSIIWDLNERTNRLHKLLELSHAALAQRPDLLVWPEAALPPTMVGRTRETQELITALVRSNGVWMVFGGIDTARRRDGDGEPFQFNAAFLIDPAGDLVARYYKRHLVMFGEYMPAIRWLPFLRYFRQGGGGMEAGRHPASFQMQQPRARISPLICFEDVFPAETRVSVDADTDFLLNLTNNGWFGESAAQWQHAMCALFRAVENGLPLVRCTNNGLTCWIDANGRIHDAYFPGSLNIYQAGYKIVTIPLRPAGPSQPLTIYHRFGDWFGWTCVLLMVARAAWTFASARRTGS